MTPERWQQISRVYQSALEQAPANRAAFVADACRDDSDLRREVESLLAREQASVLIDHPVHTAAAAVLTSAPGLTPGSLIGAYRVTALIGEGGMGQVYRARDTKLNRDVALKILPESFVHDPDRLARFSREAQVLASLNHPNIGAIHGFEDSGPVHALVLELVEGPTLADRIAHGPIPVDEALPIAGQIGEALEAAHEHGIVHRDLKPANIKVREDGTVKVLDFGLAKASQGKGGEGEGGRAVSVGGLEGTGGQAMALSQSPTIMSPAVTAMGVILGTAAYMSPEQAKGKPADKRSDIWAFGCVLYEMLTGTRAFEGEDVSDTLAAVLRGQPDWMRLPRATPARVVSLLQRCLDKDRNRRVADISTVLFVLHEPTLDPAAAPASVVTRRSWMAIAAVLLGGVAIAVGVLVGVRSSPEPTIPPLRLELTTAPTSDLVSLAVSPDGRFVTYVASSNGIPQLWLRPLDAPSPRPLANTDGASNPFWSPDSRAIAFFADGMLKRVDLPGAVVRTVTRASGSNRGGTWSSDGTILFVRTNGSSIQRVASEGGEPAIAVPTGRREERNFPSVLPDGKRVLFFFNDLNNRERNGVYLRDADGRETRLLEADAAATFVAPSHLFFVRQGSLFVQELDLTRLKMVGSPRSIGDGVTIDTSRSHAAFAASASGVLIYRSGAPVRQPRQLVWVDRTGRELQRFPVLDDGASPAPSVALAPDGEHVALSRTLNGAQAVWVFGLRDATLNRLTFNPSNLAQWSPDGRRIVFRSPGIGVIIRSAFGAGTDVPLPSTVAGAPTDWSRDGRYVLLRSPAESTGYDVWALAVDEARMMPVVQTRFDDMDAQLSPDGRWVVYQSNESGRFEVYLQEFRGTRRLQVSAEGGAQVRWRADGKELFYVALDGRLMAVPVRGDEQIELGAATALFSTRTGAVADGVTPQQYAVSADGQRFLVNTVADQPSTPINVVLNWRR